MNTSVTLINTIQYQILEYSTLKITYATLLFIGSQMLGITFVLLYQNIHPLMPNRPHRGYWLVQQKFKISTKNVRRRMLAIPSCHSLVYPVVDAHI